MMGVVMAVYPRWSGELFETLLCKINEIGLSPLARGTLNEAWASIKTGRFIPAGAGNSAQRQ